MKMLLALSATKKRETFHVIPLKPIKIFVHRQILLKKVIQHTRKKVRIS